MQGKKNGSIYGLNGINDKPIFVGSRLKMDVSHFKGVGTVVHKDDMFLIQWREDDFSELSGDNLYSEIID